MSADLIHAGLGWPTAGILAALSFAASFITVAFGIGGGAVMLAVLAVMLPAAAIIPVHRNGERVAGRIGDVESVHITSRDPGAPPPVVFPEARPGQQDAVGVLVLARQIVLAAQT